jgi:DnaK suppressor protein
MTVKKLAIDSLEPLTDAGIKKRGYPDKYVPTDKEEYMSLKMLAYFRDLLLTWRKELVSGNLETIHDLQETSSIESDLADQATLELDQMLELKNRDRARKLISKIDEALDRIRGGEFGYCVETGDPIGVKRLTARPIATLSIEAKRRQEKKEESYAG